MRSLRTRRTSRPFFEGLESREMLSTMPMIHHQPSVRVAEVSAFSVKTKNRGAHQAQTPALLAQLPLNPQVAVSTVPSNGDVNPYGVAYVPADFAPGGLLNPGDVLVSNFNNSANLQGTGTTILRVTPGGQTSTFFQGAAGLGLTRAGGPAARVRGGGERADGRWNGGDGAAGLAARPGQERQRGAEPHRQEPVEWSVGAGGGGSWSRRPACSSATCWAVR